MEVNADFSRRTVVHSTELPWLPSPMAGVERRLLDRIGDEVARATTIVRYAPNSHFSAHTHTGGEEFIVLDGVFQDEHGDYPAGTYIRNPPTSAHTPKSDGGCTIFVKLWQFDKNDRTAVKLDMNKMGKVHSKDRPGIALTPMFEDQRETVQLERWEAQTQDMLEAPQGAEILVLEGELDAGDEHLHQYSWMRLPIGSRAQLKAGPKGAKLWVKTRHLRFVEPPTP